MQTKLGAFCPMTPVQECITMPDSVHCIFLGALVASNRTSEILNWMRTPFVARKHQKHGGNERNGAKVGRKRDCCALAVKIRNSGEMENYRRPDELELGSAILNFCRARGRWLENNRSASH